MTFPVKDWEREFSCFASLLLCLFAELFLYLRQYKTPHPWQAVIIYPSRNIEREQNLQFGEILLLERVTRIYLDELGESSLGVGVVKLVIETEKAAPALARRLIAQANQQLTDNKIKRDLINLIETIIVYKLPKKSRKEIEPMLGLSELKQTRVYQEALEEGKAEGQAEATRKFALKLLRTGMNLQQIAEVTELSLQQVQALQKEIQQS
ncbi:MAG: Rpn family recombination-promoting nuclease/putative transposase [Dolichospermum sp.]